MSHYYNPNIPLETALLMFEDPHVKYEIIEDYYAALGIIALIPEQGVDNEPDQHEPTEYDRAS